MRELVTASSLPKSAIESVDDTVRRLLTIYLDTLPPDMPGAKT